MAVEDRAKTGLIVGGGAALGTALAILLTRRAEVAPPTDEAMLKFLESIAQSGLSIDSDTSEILAALNNIAASLGVLQNPPDITAWRTLVPAVNTPVQLPDRVVPYGLELVIKALPTNMGLIYVANSRPEVMNINSVYQLIANEAIEYRISNSSELWVNATRAGEGVVCTVEQRPGG